MIREQKQHCFQSFSLLLFNYDNSFILKENKQIQTIDDMLMLIVQGYWIYYCCIHFTDGTIKMRWNMRNWNICTNAVSLSMITLV